MKIALQMDHISTIDKTTDTTFALGLEAYNRGYNLFYYTPADLFMKIRRFLPGCNLWS